MNINIDRLGNRYFFSVFFHRSDIDLNIISILFEYTFVWHRNRVLIQTSVRCANSTTYSHTSFDFGNRCKHEVSIRVFFFLRTEYKFNETNRTGVATNMKNEIQSFSNGNFLIFTYVFVVVFFLAISCSFDTSM